MSLLQEHQIQTSVYLCTFECFIRQANIAMKFPCTYFVEWRTINSKSAALTNRHPPHEGAVAFEERISLQVEMLFDHSKLEFLRRETIVELFLVSKSRPDQNKLVGRVNIDLGKVANVGMYEEPTEFKLNFCSIEGSIVMQFRPLEQRLTSLTIQDLDKSSFIDFISQTTLKAQNRNQSMVLSRHENNSLEKDRITRSDLRGISPGSPKSIVKSAIIPKSNHVKFDQESKSGGVRDSKGDFNKFLNDESEAKQKIGLNSSKININMEHLMEQDILAEEKQSEVKQSFEPAPPAFTFQDEIVNSQTINFPNIQKTSSSPIFQPNLSENNLVKESKQMNSHPTLTQKQEVAPERIGKELKQQQTGQIWEENEKLKHQMQKLLDENDLLFREKEKSDQKIAETASLLTETRAQVGQLQQQLTRKSKIIEKLGSELTDKQTTIKYLQQQINHLSAASQQQQNSSQTEGLKARINSLETQSKQLNQDMKTASASYENKLNNYEQIIRQLEKERNDCQALINAHADSERTFKAKLKDLQVENNQLVDSLQTARKDLENKAQSSLKQSADLEQHSKNRAELEEDIGRLQRELEEALLKYDQAEKDLGEIQGKYMELENLYDEQVSANELLQMQLQDLAASKQQPAEIIEQQIILNRSIVLEAGKTGNEAQEGTSALVEQLRAQNESLSNEVEFLKSHAELVEREFTNSLESLQHENESLKEEIMSLEVKLAGTNQTESKLKELLTVNADLQSENEKLREEVGKTHQEREEVIMGKLLQENEQLREQARTVQAQVQFYEKELVVLKEEIVRIRQNREAKKEKVKYEEMITKLNVNLEEQINQNMELQEAIVRYMEKEAKMKETLEVLERESKEIFMLVREKEQNEETYQKAIEELQIELLSLKGRQSSPTHNNTANEQYSPQRETAFEVNAQLIASLKQVQQANSKLNEEVMHLSLAYNQAKTKLQEQVEASSNLQAEIEQLRQDLINFEAQKRREDEASAVKLKESERAIKNRDIQLEILRSRSKERESGHRGLESEMGRLRAALQEIEEEKFNLQSTNNEKDIKIIQLQDELAALRSTLAPVPSIESKTDHFTTQLDMLGELRERLLQKNLNSDWDSLLQSILDRSMNVQETAKLLSLEQKSRMLSKELQKMKAQLLKSDWRNQQEKLAAMGLFKKCEAIVTQLIAAAESLNQNQSSFL